ncbi:ComF family protein [Liquorilactobacillus sicerae]|uniref:ComF family protein n=1 Tax=Liquorilactobacillus sicerae TaxID=1416943 RepID=UPI00248188FC|nr:ComF family protein [Liquorilactobacillus sicerae]
MRICLLCQQNSIESNLLDWLFDFTGHEKYLCQKCQQQFIPINPQTACPGCGRKQAVKKICQDCQSWAKNSSQQLLNNRALFCYNLQMKKYFEKYKFQGDYQLRLIFQKKFQQVIKQIGNKKIIIPIPVSPTTWQQRGFNQVEGFLAGTDYLDVLIVKPDFFKDSQSHKKRYQRLALPQPFTLKSQINLQQKDCLLIDDVYTTGRTLYHASKVLQAAGVSSIKSLTLAR